MTELLEELQERFDTNFIQIYEARKALLDAVNQLEGDKELLKDRETALLILGKEGPINGGNDKIREAQLRDATTQERSNIRVSSLEKEIAEYKLALCLDARRNLESILKIQEIEKW